MLFLSIRVLPSVLCMKSFAMSTRNLLHHLTDLLIEANLLIPQLVLDVIKVILHKEILHYRITIK